MSHFPRRISPIKRICEKKENFPFLVSRRRPLTYSYLHLQSNGGFFPLSPSLLPPAPFCGACSWLTEPRGNDKRKQGSRRVEVVVVALFVPTFLICHHTIFLPRKLPPPLSSGTLKYDTGSVPIVTGRISGELRLLVKKEEEREGYTNLASKK